MFENIGRKIKVVALVIFGLGVAGSAVFGVYYVNMGRNLLGWETTKSIIIFWSIIVAGFLTSWFISMLLYGFGELIDTNQHIASNTKKIKRFLSKTAVIEKEKR